LEKADLLDLLQNRRERRPGRDATPRGPADQHQPQSPSKQPAPQNAAHDAARASRGGGAADSQVPGGPRALRVKMLSVGSGAVGKSTLIKRYCEGRFVQKYITTIGIDYGVKPTKVLGADVKVNFFDTSGGDDFKDIRVEFYAKTTCVMLVYDVTNRYSFSDLDSWLVEAKRHDCPLSKTHRSKDGPVVILCANKVDLPRRCVSREEGSDFAATHGMFYFETSAATGESVVEAMNCALSNVVSQHQETRKRLAGGA